MSEYIHKSHNVSVLMYHFVCPAKYRRVVFSDEVDVGLKEICQEIELRYGIRFLEIGTDRDHVHFLIQSVPKYSPSQLNTHCEKHHCKTDFSKISRGQEKVVGWRVLVRWLLRWYGRQTRRRNCDWAVCARTGHRIRI